MNTKDSERLATKPTDEWMTPPDVVADVKAVLGKIDLDPASSLKANETVGASRIFTEEDNGLIQDWKASTIFLNPPYSRPLCGPFCLKLLQVYNESKIEQAILLVNSSTSTRYFQALAAEANRGAMCFQAGRISFVHETLAAGKPRYDSVFFYLGPKAHRFMEVFSKRGVIK